jgi:hypothetical protein
MLIIRLKQTLAQEQDKLWERAYGPCSIQNKKDHTLFLKVY